jgi:2-polyprenyl-3-methyl-5-hydroxy-6-metoxy-1,4-benzoquinol methylase
VEDVRSHWDGAWTRRAASSQSWYQAEPALSFELIRRAAPEMQAAIIDVGGGASVLVDRLLDAGYQDVTVLDVSDVALRIAQERLGSSAGKVQWIHCDVLEYTARRAYDVWHDRAVFHFLTAPADQEAYVAVATGAVRSGGSLVVATFAADGPARCSGLDVHRYAPTELERAFDTGFLLVETCQEAHRTPAGVMQPFLYASFRRR